MVYRCFCPLTTWIIPVWARVVTMSYALVFGISNLPQISSNVIPSGFFDTSFNISTVRRVVLFNFILPPALQLSLEKSPKAPASINPLYPLLGTYAAIRICTFVRIYVLYTDIRFFISSIHNMKSKCKGLLYSVTPCLKIAISWNPASSDFTFFPEAT